MRPLSVLHLFRKTSLTKQHLLPPNVFTHFFWNMLQCNISWTLFVVYKILVVTKYLVRRLNTKVLRFSVFICIILMFLWIDKMLSGEYSVEINRPLRCDGCFEFDFSIIQNKDICKQLMNKARPTLLILIFTIHSNTAARKTLRETWLSPTLNNTSDVRYAFLVGKIDNDTLNIKLQEENAIYNDIIHFDFVDSYRNLTYKTLFGFKWAASFCPDIKHVLKTDDDVYVNVEGLRLAIRNNKDGLEQSVGGFCNSMCKRENDPSSKYYIPSTEYPYDYYPELCNGIGYVTSMQVIVDILSVSRNIRFFPLEDVYVGFCISMLGYKSLNIFGFFHEKFVAHTPCYFKHRYFVLCHSVNLVTMRKIWETPCIKNSIF